MEKRMKEIEKFERELALEFFDKKWEELDGDEKELVTYEMYDLLDYLD